MEKKKINDILRKIIREEVTNALRQELPKLLNESKGNLKSQIKEQFNKPKIHNHKPLVTTEEYMKSMSHMSSNSPLMNMLKETAMSMDPNDPILNSGYIEPTQNIQGESSLEYDETPQASSIDQMFGTARQSAILENVQINAVPDFSAYMQKMGL